MSGGPGESEAQALAHSGDSDGRTLFCSSRCFSRCTGWWSRLSRTCLEIFAVAPQIIPAHLTGTNYSFAFGSIIGNIGVSLVIALCVAALSWLLGVPAAHGLARLGGTISSVVVMVMLVTQMIPAISISIALYTIFHQWGLLGSYTGLILADTSLLMPFVILLVRAFMVSLPGELFEAAALDGASEVRVRRLACPWQYPRS